VIWIIRSNIPTPLTFITLELEFEKPTTLEPATILPLSKALKKIKEENLSLLYTGLANKIQGKIALIILFSSNFSSFL